MKALWIIIGVLLMFSCQAAGSGSSGEKDTFSKYMFDQVHIEGKTNVNSFHLEYREDEFCRVPGDLNAENANLEIDIPAAQVEADSQAMLKDFLELINAAEYPNISIEIARNEVRFQHAEEEMKMIELSLNGIKKQFECTTYTQACFGDQWCLNGQLKIRLTDFDIEPPHKFLGLVKVKDEIFINFRILFS